MDVGEDVPRSKTQLQEYDTSGYMFQGEGLSVVDITETLLMAEWQLQ